VLAEDIAGLAPILFFGPLDGVGPAALGARSARLNDPKEAFEDEPAFRDGGSMRQRTADRYQE
jgi:hypothetical protein